MIEKAVELRPDDGYIVDSLGWVAYRLGDFEEAVRQLERAVQLVAGDPIINDHLGDAYWQVGRSHEARFQWRRVLTPRPGGRSGRPGPAQDRGRSLRRCGSRRITVRDRR